MRKLIVFSILAFCAMLLSACTSNSWTLMVCATSHPTGGCNDNSYVLEGYSSQKDCMEKGLELNNPAGFECGRACETRDYGIMVCEEVCNERGCS